MTDPAMMTTCPTEETLAAFIDGRLEGRARERVIEHVAVCSECRDSIAVAREIELENEDEGIPSSTVTPFRPKRSYRLAAAVAALAASIAAVFFSSPTVNEMVRYGSDGGRNKVKVLYQQQPERMVRPRFSGFPYKKIKPTMRDANPESPPSDSGTLGLYVTVDDLKKVRSWRPLRARAIAEALVGDRDDAIQSIEKAKEAGGDADPEFLNDLAAIYIERAGFGGSQDNGRALAASERAWNVAKTPESAWNRALALEQAGRDADALEAWQEYIRLDPNSEWTTEAAGRINFLQTSAP